MRPSTPIQIAVSGSRSTIVATQSSAILSMGVLGRTGCSVIRPAYVLSGTAGLLLGEVPLEKGDDRVDGVLLVGTHGDLVAVVDVERQDAQDARRVDTAPVGFEPHGNSGTGGGQAHQ